MAKQIAIQYRSMHTAIHHLILFENKSNAWNAFRMLQQLIKCRNDDEYYSLIDNIFEKSINDIEVDFRTIRNNPQYEIVNDIVYDLYI